MAPPLPIRAELRALTRLAIPLAIAQGGQALMGVVDTAIVGRAGAVPLAATGLGNALFFGIAIFGMGVMHGLDPLISQAVGAGDRPRARRLLWQGAWLALLLTVALGPVVVLARGALVPLGIGAEVGREASAYMALRLPGLPFLFLYFAGRAYLQAFGRARPIVVATVLANLVNVPADLLLVFGGSTLPSWTGPLRLVPAMGASGAAVATSICTVLQAAILLGVAARLAGPAAAPRRWRPRGEDLRASFAVGAPIGLHMGAEMGIFALVSFLAGRLGTEALGAHQLAIAVASLTFTVAIGFGNAGSVRVGLAVGAGDRAAARRAGLAAFASGAAFMSLSALVFVLFPGAIASAMTDDPGVAATAVPLLRIAALFQLSDGIQGVGAGVLRGAGETRFTFAANMVGHWLVGLPATLVLGFGLGYGVTGLWGGFCFGLTAVAAALVWRFLRVSGREITPLAGRAVA